MVTETEESGVSVFAISDLHLPGGDTKPMDVFGEHWKDHFEKISSDWLERVKAEDVVLLPGDLSWAMSLEAAKADIQAVGRLPGRKIILRGNHDFWWSGIGRVRDALPEGMYAIQNDCVEIEDIVFCGTRGWTLPGEQTTADDQRIYRRELLRMDMALSQAQLRAQGRPIVVMMHYPPLTDACRDTEWMALFRQYGVRDVVYGHLHGGALKSAFRGEYEGVRFHQVSCDGLGFRLYQLMNL